MFKYDFLIDNVTLNNNKQNVRYLYDVDQRWIYNSYLDCK